MTSTTLKSSSLKLFNRPTLSNSLPNRLISPAFHSTKSMAAVPWFNHTSPKINSTKKVRMKEHPLWKVARFVWIHIYTRSCTPSLKQRSTQSVRTPFSKVFPTAQIQASSWPLLTQIRPWVRKKHHPLLWSSNRLALSSLTLFPKSRLRPSNTAIKRLHAWVV